MRELKIGTKRVTKVFVTDEPGEGGACHKYGLCRANTLEGSGCEFDFGWIHFQDGPIKENGVNGCHQEDLLAIVIDRLRGFQSGEFACEENRLALVHVMFALDLLNQRTKRRIDRGVEGTTQI